MAKVLNIEVPEREFKAKFRYKDSDCEITFKRVTIDEISKIRDIGLKIEKLEKEGGDISEMKAHINELFDLMVVSKNFDWDITELPMASIRALIDPAIREQGIPDDKKKA